MVAAMPDLQRAARLACECLLKAEVDQLPVPPLPLLRRCRNTRVMSLREAS